MPELADLRANPDRLWQRLMILAQCGATPAGGVNRQALSAEEIQSWHHIIGWSVQAGLEPSTDAAGNLFMTLRASNARPSSTMVPVLSGSHLDSQPTGGRFDGVYGVVAALEVLTVLAEQRIPTTCDLVAVAWMNEEGSRFAPGMMGSEAFIGVRSLESIRATRDANGVGVAQALDALHAAFPDLRRIELGFAVKAYVEAHIEQGPVLEDTHCVIGVVTGIQGKKSYEVVIQGEKGHAGTISMVKRLDALAAFSRMASALYQQIGGHDPDVKFTIGSLRVEPNAPSVVPERVTMRIDLRHPDNRVLEELGARLELLCTLHATPCSAQLTRLVDAPSNGFDAGLQVEIEAAAAQLGYSHLRLLSAAGHDARHLAAVSPAAMIFVPCRGGISHSEDEWAEPAHVSAGANVLLQVLANRVVHAGDAQ